MKKYERLTDKNRDWFEFTEINDIEIYRRLQELENKIENGTLIELPCKVGDTVYMPWEYDGIYAIAELTVNDIFLDMTIGSSSIQTNLESDSAEYMKIYRYGLFKFEDIGQKIFLTKAEAEKKLKELQNVG